MIANAALLQRFASLLLLLLLLPTQIAAQQNSPNLIITLSDDFSAVELSHLTDGFDTLEGAETPTLDKMKDEGVSFLTAWAMPICGPTRGSVLTGLYGQVTGWMSNKKPQDGGLGINYGTFATLAQQNGYKTMIAGKWQMSGEVKTYGFDESCLWAVSDDPDNPARQSYQEYDDRGGFVNPSNTSLNGQRSRYWFPFMFNNGNLMDTGPMVFGPNLVFDCAMEFVSRQTALGNKFLLYMPMLLTHADWDYFRPASERSITNFIPVPVVDASGAIIGRESGPGSMKRNIEYQDYLMGKLLSHVESVGQRSNTVTFYMGDNGSLGYGKKQQITERATRVPFIVHGPGRVQARGVTDQFASLNDVYSTVAGLIKANSTGSFQRPRQQSIDISPFLLGARPGTGRAWLYGHLEDPVKSDKNGRWIRSKQYILDGQGTYWRCPSRDERSCLEVTPAEGTYGARVKQDLETIACLLEKNRTADPSKLEQDRQCTV